MTQHGLNQNETLIAAIALWTLIITVIAFRNRTRTEILRPSCEFMAIVAVLLFVVSFNVPPLINGATLENLVWANVIIAPGFIIVALLVLSQKLASAGGLELSNRQQVFLYAVVAALILANCWWLYLVEIYTDTRRG